MHQLRVIEYHRTEEAPGKVINGLSPHTISDLGIARTFQNIRLFNDLSVLDNIRIVIHQNVKYGLFLHFRLPSFYREEQEILDKANEILKIFKLETKKDELAKTYLWRAKKTGNR